MSHGRWARPTKHNNNRPSEHAAVMITCAARSTGNTQARPLLSEGHTPNMHQKTIYPSDLLQRHPHLSITHDPDACSEQSEA